MLCPVTQWQYDLAVNPFLPITSCRVIKKTETSLNKSSFQCCFQRFVKQPTKFEHIHNIFICQFTRKQWTDVFNVIFPKVAFMF